MATISEQRPTTTATRRGEGGGSLVIACLDETSGGARVAGVAASLSARLRARLMLATVQPAAAGAPMDPASVGRGRRLVARVAREIDHPAELRVAFGEPAERLIALAQREAAELIVIGAPASAPTRPSLLGNAHLALAGAGPCPVVVVPRDTGPPPGAEGPVVCGVDGSRPSLAAARIAAELAEALDVTLRLVDVPPAQRLAEAAEHESAALVVTAARGRDVPAATLLGSVSARLAATTTRPLVIVP